MQDSLETVPCIQKKNQVKDYEIISPPYPTLLIFHLKQRDTCEQYHYNTRNIVGNYSILSINHVNIRLKKKKTQKALNLYFN